MRITLMLLVLASLCAPQLSFAEPAAATKSAGRAVPVEIPASVYRARRERLMQQLGSCVAVLKAVPRAGKYGDDFDPYFFYLTGIDESGAMLVLAPKEPIFRQSLSLRPRDPESEIWEGYREPMSVSLRKKYLFDVVSRSRGSLPRAFGRALGRARCYAKLRSAFAKPDIAPAVLGKYTSSYGARTEQRWQELERLRAVHDVHEIARMEKAIAITKEGQRAAARELKPGATERQIASRIEDAFFQAGGTGLAFPSIVGSAQNGAVLHWDKRNRVVQQGDLAVVDIGASYGGYASDITRTYPVSGKFSAEQRKVYQAVLDAQNKTIAAVKPGITLDRLHRIAEQAINDAGYELPHYVGHFVGIEVHDVGNSGAPLEAGMVITVEPGIYIKGRFGVRIEDEVLVTPRGGRLLSSDIPREVAEVEAWMRTARGH